MRAIADLVLVPLSGAFALAALLGPALIAFLRRLSYRQQAYEDAPETHQKKTGTPTMGGLLFLAAPVAAVGAIAAYAMRDPSAPASLKTVVAALALLIVGCGVIGFIDDYSAIRRGRNRGLNARMKFLLTVLIGVAFLQVVLHAAPAGTPLLWAGTVPLWLWYALSLCVILATTHAVNLTDGLDGLASGTIVPPLAVFAVLAFAMMVAGGSATSIVALAFALATIGAVLGFLIYNRHPAKMFMGDTGSLALGAALAGIAILTGGHLPLLVIGGVFVAETLSVMIQVTSYKLTKKRVFRMSPLHHHFELGGWPETKVTRTFWASSLVLSVIGFVLAVRA